MSDFRPKIKKIALDNSKLSLQCPNAAGKLATLKWGLKKNNPQLTVWTNEPNDTKDYGKIVGSTDTPHFYAFLEMVRSAALSVGECRFSIDCKNHTWANNKRSETPVVTARLVCGKDEQGCVFISVVAHGRPNLKFVLAPNTWHSFRDAGGNEMPAAEASKFFALGLVKAIEKIMANVQVTEYVEPEPPKQGGYGQGGGGQGGGYGQGQGGGQGQGAGRQAGGAPAATSIIDEEIPW
jgi:hypothetical protein